MQPSLKIAFVNFVIQSMFDEQLVESNQAIKNLIDKNRVLQKHRPVTDFTGMKKDGSFIYEGQRYEAQKNKKDISLGLLMAVCPPPEKEIVPELDHHIKVIKDINFNKTRFTGLLNNLISLVKSDGDFQFVFKDILQEEIAQFNVQFDGALGTKLKSPITLDFMSKTRLKHIKETFQTELARLDFLKNILRL